MSAPNFKTMQEFPLIVTETPYCKRCPECGCCNGDDADVCDECGASLADVTAEYDEFADEDNVANMEWYADKANEAQKFYTVTVQGGRYTGLQFYVEAEYEIDNWDDGDAEYHYGESLAKVQADYAKAAATVNEWLAKAKDELGLTELVCVAMFSNGEAVYRRAA